MLKIKYGNIFVVIVTLSLLGAMSNGATVDEKKSLELSDINPKKMIQPDMYMIDISPSENIILEQLIELKISIDRVTEDYIRVMVSPEQLHLIIECEYSYVYVEAEETGGRDDFHNYAELTSELQDIVTTYPNIARLYDLGQSVQGRTIWGLKITDNPDIEENEPEFRICGLHHGNEYMSGEVSLLMCWYLVEEYGVDPLITGLVNTREIWLIPMVNPDGREAHTRVNANGVDLNRDYGYMWGGYSGDEPFSQPETKVVREHALDNNFVLSLSFHTSGDIVNYIWNYKGQPVPDEDVVVTLSEQYGSYNGYWVVEGFDWYQTRGDTNDFSYGCRGGIDWTIETQNYNIPQAWDYNRDAMIDLIDAADWGLTGIVTDASTGEPLQATIWVEEIFWPCFTDPKIGDYHKPLLEGAYQVHYMANGYEEQVHEVVITNHEVPVVLDVALHPGGGRYAHQVVWCNFYDPYSYPNNYQNNPTDAVFALGPPDETFGSLGVGGVMVVDMSENAMIINGPGDDFTVFEGDDGTSEGYHVSVSDSWEMNGVWTHIGSATGTSSFDLEGSGVEQTRYVRIQDDYGGNAYEYCPGFDVDAIQSLHTSSEIDPDLSFVTLTDDRMPGMFTCPDGDGPAYQYVKVTVKDSYGVPVVGLPAEAFDFSITAGSETFVYGTLNCTFTAVDTMTNSNGEIRFEVVADTAITGDLNTNNPGILIIEAIVDEIPLNDVDELECRSPDYVPDGDVDLSDLVLFAQDFYNYGLRSDFNWDGDCNLVDFVFFAQHYGHRAISVENFRIKRFIPSFFSLK